MAIERSEASVEADRAKAQRGMDGKTTPLYVVCSPCRGVGKTLISRLLTEFHVLADRRVAAFDLADEGPQLADYLPQLTTIANINDIFGQMAFFERLIGDDAGAKIIDLSHRAFDNFFSVVQEIGFFEEARRRSIEPLILFVIDRDPRSPTAYASLRRRFADASLLPVLNRAETRAVSRRGPAPDADSFPALLEIPLLTFSLRALIDRQSFSFCESLRAPPGALPEGLDDELQSWLAGVFFQIGNLELSLGCDGAAERAAVAGSMPTAAESSGATIAFAWPSPFCSHRLTSYGKSMRAPVRSSTTLTRGRCGSGA